MWLRSSAAWPGSGARCKRCAVGQGSVRQVDIPRADSKQLGAGYPQIPSLCQSSSWPSSICTDWWVYSATKPSVNLLIERI